jgi:PIN domain nuclease of toxin-antitoxin system
VRILLDTHMLLWFLNDPLMLPKKADELIFDPNNLVFVSSVSLWEIAIKTALGKLTLEADIGELELICERSNLIVTSFHAAHALAVHDLPNHHRDPFDRALIAQARLEQMKLLTHDSVLHLYGASVLTV